MSEEKKNMLKEIFEWAYCILIALVLASAVRYFLGTPTIVKQTSMDPTFKQNDRLILNRLYRTFKTTPARGDIITFASPSNNYLNDEKVDLENPIAEYNNEPKGLIGKFFYNVVEITKTSYIKRIIALPGEHIEIKDGKVYINGEELEENYLAEGVETNADGGQFLDIVVPENYVFVMGDNRSHSADSRRFGCIPYNKIEGKVVFRFWPFSVWGKIN